MPPKYPIERIGYFPDKFAVLHGAAPQLPDDAARDRACGYSSIAFAPRDDRLVAAADDAARYGATLRVAAERTVQKGASAQFADDSAEHADNRVFIGAVNI